MSSSIIYHIRQNIHGLFDKDNIAGSSICLFSSRWPVWLGFQDLSGHLPTGYWDGGPSEKKDI